MREPSASATADGDDDWPNPATFDFLERESRAKRPGADTVITRLADVLFIEAIRSYFSSPEAEKLGLSVALQEPRVGAALASIYKAPEADWSVGPLAKRVGMSRTAFATRFAQLVGEPPLGYVTPVEWTARLRCCAAPARPFQKSPSESGMSPSLGFPARLRTPSIEHSQPTQGGVQ